MEYMTVVSTVFILSGVIVLVVQKIAEVTKDMSEAIQNIVK